MATIVSSDFMMYDRLVRVRGRIRIRVRVRVRVVVCLYLGFICAYDYCVNSRMVSGNNKEKERGERYAREEGAFAVGTNALGAAALHQANLTRGDAALAADLLVFVILGSIQF